MNDQKPVSYIGPVVILGALWGTSEAAVGAGLKACAASVSGSLMTGVALLFIAAAWVVSRRYQGIALLVLIAALFKMFDALLLSVPVTHSSITHPIFAFVTEGAAFCVIIFLMEKTLSRRWTGQALAGGVGALMAVNLFPLVKFATGSSACVIPGTGYPLSLYYAHFAVLASMITVPLGFLAGKKIASLRGKKTDLSWQRRFDFILSPAVLVLSLLIVLLIRLA